VRDGIRTDLGYDARTCEIMDSGQPPPRCGDVFLAVHPAGSRNDMIGALNEYLAFSVTLTMRVVVPHDRVGDQLLARKLAQKVGFNARADQVAVYLHSNWILMGQANNLLYELSPQATTVYAFSEPWQFLDMDTPSLVGGEWFAAKPEARDVGLVAEIRFGECRRCSVEW